MSLPCTGKDGVLPAPVNREECILRSELVKIGQSHSKPCLNLEAENQCNSNPAMPNQLQTQPQNGEVGGIATD